MKQRILGYRTPPCHRRPVIATQSSISYQVGGRGPIEEDPKIPESQWEQVTIAQVYTSAPQVACLGFQGINTAPLAPGCRPPMYPDPEFPTTRMALGKTGKIKKWGKQWENGVEWGGEMGEHEWKMEH